MFEMFGQFMGVCTAGKPQFTGSVLCDVDSDCADGMFCQVGDDEGCPYNSCGVLGTYAYGAPARFCVNCNLCGYSGSDTCDATCAGKVPSSYYLTQVELDGSIYVDHLLDIKTGQTSYDWQTTSTWDGGSVPAKDSVVYLPSSSTEYTVTSAEAIKASVFLLGKGASLDLVRLHTIRGPGLIHTDEWNRV